MPNVPENPNFEAIIAFGNLGNISGFQLSFPQVARVYPDTAKVLVADAGIAPGTVLVSQYSVLRDAGQNQSFIEPAIHLLLQAEVNGPYQSSFDLLKSETTRTNGNLDLLKSEKAIGDGSLSMLADRPVMVIDSIDAAPPGFAPPPPSSQQTRGSGPGYQWIVMCDQKGRKLVGFYTGYISTDTNPRQLIEDLPCDFVILSVQTTLDDNIDTLKATGSFAYFDTNEEVYWGFGTVCIHQIFPGETTQYLAVRNANQLSVRCSKSNSGIAVAFSAFRYEEEDVVL